MTTEIRTRTVEYQVTVHHSANTATGTAAHDTVETRFRVETYEVDVFEPAPADGQLPPGARLLTVDEYEDTNGDGELNAGDVPVATRNYFDAAVVAGDDGAFADTVPLGSLTDESVQGVPEVGAEQLAIMYLTAQMPGVTLTPQAQTFWRTLTIEQQRQMIAVVTQAGPDGDAALARMMSSPEGQARLLADATSQGELPLLQSLADIANEELMGPTADAPERFDLGTVRGTLLDDILQTIENPLLVTQGGAGSCTMASAQVILARERPAEYARIMRDLVITGSAQLAGDTYVYLPVDVVPNENVGGYRRRQDDYLFQSALMQEVQRVDENDPDLVYDPGTDDAFETAGAGAYAVWSQLFGGAASVWPNELLIPEIFLMEDAAIFLGMYPREGSGHVVAVLGIESETRIDPDTGEETVEYYVIVRNTLPEGVSSALRQDGVAPGEVTRVPFSSLTDGTYPGGAVVIVAAIDY